MSCWSETVQPSGRKWVHYPKWVGSLSVGNDSKQNWWVMRVEIRVSLFFMKTRNWRAASTCSSREWATRVGRKSETCLGRKSETRFTLRQISSGMAGFRKKSRRELYYSHGERLEFFHHEAHARMTQYKFPVLRARSLSEAPEISKLLI